MADVPELSLSLFEENIEDVSREVVTYLRPQWSFENAVVERCREGFLNIVLLCYADIAKNERDAIVIKNCVETFNGPLDKWKHAVKVLPRHKLGAPILAFLQNGICMEMVIGEKQGFESPRSFEDGYRELVAEEMARWHCQAVYEDAKRLGVKKSTALGVHIFNHWDEIFDGEKLREYKEDYPTEEMLVGTLNRYENELLEGGDLEERFVHYDMNGANIFITDYNEKGIEVVDFDFVGIGFVQHDIAWFFRIMREITQPRSDPGREYEFKFIKRYLQYRNELDAKPEPTEDEVERLYRGVQKAKVIVHLRIMACSVNILHYKEGKTLPDVVEGGPQAEGMDVFIHRNIEYWNELGVYKEKMFKSFA